MAAALALCRFIDEINRRVGVIAVYLVLLAAMLSAFNALVRYSVTGVIYLDRQLALFGGGLGWLIDTYRDNSNVMGDGQLAMFSGMVMLGAAYTLKMNEHVRVDLVYGSVSPRTRLWIDLLGGIFFLLPMCILMIYFTWPWFLQSWRSHEMSANAGGLPRWPAQLCLPLGFALVALQGVSEIIKSAAALMGRYAYDHAYEKPLQ